MTFKYLMRRYESFISYNICKKKLKELKIEQLERERKEDFDKLAKALLKI